MEIGLLVCELRGPYAVVLRADPLIRIDASVARMIIWDDGLCVFGTPGLGLGPVGYRVVTEADGAVIARRVA